jgi:hypothetical protein
VVTVYNLGRPEDSSRGNAHESDDEDQVPNALYSSKKISMRDYASYTLTRGIFEGFFLEKQSVVVAVFTVHRSSHD